MHSFSQELHSTVVQGLGWWMLESHGLGSSASCRTYLLSDLGKFADLSVFINLMW